MDPSDFSHSIPLNFTSSAYVSSYGSCGLPTTCDLSCSVNDFPNIPSSLRRAVLHGCFSRFFTVSMAFSLTEKLGSPWFPSGLTFRRCKVCFVLRAAGLRLLIGGIQRFSTIGHPKALVACYVASWQLRPPDFHRLAVDRLSGHTSGGYAAQYNDRLLGENRHQKVL